MYLLRCTQRLRSAVRRHLPTCAAADRSTTRLGDWYASRLNSAQRRYVIVTSARTLLTLVVPARDPAALPDRIHEALDLLLHTIGVPSPARERELRRMATVCVATTADRSVLASMSAMAQRAWEELHDLPHRPGRTLARIDALLAGLPLARLHYRSPAELTVSLLTTRSPRLASR